MKKSLFIVKYAIRRMARDAIKSMILILVALSFTVLTCELSYSLEKQYVKLGEAYENIVVEGFLTKKDGTEAKVYSKYIRMFNKVEGEYHSYIKDICLKRTVYYLPKEDYVLSEDEQLPCLIGISRVKADIDILPISGVEITYYEGFDETLFEGDQNICLVSDALAEGTLENMPKIDNDGYITIYAYIELFTREMLKVPLKLEVAGEYTNGEKNIYCPWLLIEDILDNDYVGDMYSEGLRFTISENDRIDEFKDKASEIFVSTGYMGDDKDDVVQYALTVMDEQLVQTVTPLKKNISMLEKMKPVIFVLSAAIGFIACMLFVRNRKPEFANMRSMGTSKGLVFMEAFFEQALLGVSGVVIGVCIYFILHGLEASLEVMDILTFFACYLAGASVAVINITRINVMKIMKAKE
jgi:hypothetical protein